MPRDTAPMPSKSTPSLAALFASQGDDDAPDDIDVRGLPPTLAPVRRIARTMPVPDLTGLSKAWALIGSGGAGKTVLARYLGGELAAHGALDRTMMAALDPANRTLADFFGAVMQPPSSDPAETVIWLRNLLQFLAKQRGNAVLDFGGGDVSLARLVESAPTIADTMEGEGVALVAAYVLTPRVDDLTSLVTFESRGFRPRATALVLNLARAETPAAFDAVRRQPAYKAALARGAVELWLPALEPQALALRIEQARLQFAQARDGVTPEGRREAGISLLERVLVREFMERMEEEFRVVETWLPWT